MARGCQRGAVLLLELDAYSPLGGKIMSCKEDVRGTVYESFMVREWLREQARREFEEAVMFVAEEPEINQQGT